MPGSPFLGVHHVALVAHDGPALAAFYARAAGMTPWPALAALGLDGDAIALAGPNAGLRIVAGGAAPVRRPVSEAGFTHLCLQSPGIAPLHAAHAAAGASFHSPLVDLGTGFLYCYARDPEHNVIELEGVAPVWQDATPWIAHVNVACADIARQGAFYSALLDAPLVRSPRLQGDTRLDAIADLPGVALRMAWVAAGNMQIELIHYSQPQAMATTSASSRRVPGASGHAYVAFEVERLDAACQHLVHCGGSVSDAPSARGGVKAADTEGNPLWLLDRHGLAEHKATLAQLAQPDIAARFAAARSALQGTR
jgi:catechol 2,3-dioxygenase-like lactoylglutathione lyase family enzyme